MFFFNLFFFFFKKQKTKIIPKTQSELMYENQLYFFLRICLRGFHLRKLKTYLNLYETIPVKRFCNIIQIENKKSELNNNKIINNEIKKKDIPIFQNQIITKQQLIQFQCHLVKLKCSMKQLRRFDGVISSAIWVSDANYDFYIKDVCYFFFFLFFSILLLLKGYYLCSSIKTKTNWKIC